MSLNVSELYATYWEPICRWLHRTAPGLTTDDIEDVAMVVFEKAARAAAAGTYRDQGTPGSWLYMVARNALTDYWREQQRHPKSDEIDNDAPGGRATVDAGSQLHLTRIEVATAIRRLPDRQRIAMLEQYWIGSDLRTTAEILGISVESVKKVRKRARRNLYDLLTDAA